MQNTKLDLNKLKKDTMELWINSSGVFPEMRCKVTFMEKLKKEKKLDSKLDIILQLLNQLKNDDKTLWKSKIKTICRECFLDSCNITLKDNFRANKFVEEFSDLTDSFIKASREFDENISIEDILQALRNVWAMGLFQWITFKKVKLTKSIFAYSMLYPYTDNYLDDPNISKEEKKRFNFYVSKKLQGIKVNACNKKIFQVFKLIELIEEEFPRSSYGELYEVMLKMQYAQEKSLSQHNYDKNNELNEKRLLDISMEKGGTSVLLHGYLVKGNITYEESKFLFEFGVILQICDDIQDVIEDMFNGHNTLITKVGHSWKLDVITNNLLNFTQVLFQYIKTRLNSEDLWLSEIIEYKVLNIIFFAICRNRKLYSKKYVRNISRYFPYRVIYIRRLNYKLNNQFRKIKKNIGEDSLEELLLV